MWLRNGTAFAEARVFERGSNPTISGVLDTIQVQSKDDARAVALLETWIEKKFGGITWVRWQAPPTDAGSRERPAENRRRATSLARETIAIMGLPSHAYCDFCEKVQPVTCEAPSHPDDTGLYKGGDVLCNVCGWIVCTFYEPLETKALVETAGLGRKPD